MREAAFFSVVVVALAIAPTTGRAQLSTDRLVRFLIPEVELGVSLAVDADTVLLGTNGPEAYVFRFDGANWWMDRLTVPGTTEWDWFDAVSLHEDLALIGVWSSPVAYVFRFDGTRWVHQATLSDDRGRSGFGASVDVQGDIAVVAVPGSEVQVFRFDGSYWNREARLVPPGDVGPYGFAEQVVLDDDRVLVSKDSRIGDRFEGVFSYRYEGAGWRHEGTITLSDTETVFAGAIALDGDVALIDADYDDVVHVFRFDGAEWKREAILEPPELNTRNCSCLPIPSGDRERCDGGTPNFGVSVAVDGNLALVGANLDDVAATDSGAAYLYRYDGTRWNFESMLEGEPTSSCGTNFGRLVALHDRSALVRQGYSAYFFRIR